MREIVVKIEKSKDSFGAYAEKLPIWGSGKTVQETIESVKEMIELFVSSNKPENIPIELKEPYKLVYKYDTASLLSAYKGILTPPALEALTGINQKQIHHYASGFKKPRPAQREKIKNALHDLGQQLLAVDL